MTYKTFVKSELIILNISPTVFVNDELKNSKWDFLQPGSQMFLSMAAG